MKISKTAFLVSFIAGVTLSSCFSSPITDWNTSIKEVFSDKTWASFFQEKAQWLRETWAKEAEQEQTQDSIKSRQISLIKADHEKALKAWTARRRSTCEAIGNNNLTSLPQIIGMEDAGFELNQLSREKCLESYSAYQPQPQLKDYFYAAGRIDLYQDLNP